jgi:chromosome partitioning protein
MTNETLALIRAKPTRRSKTSSILELAAAAASVEAPSSATKRMKRLLLNSPKGGCGKTELTKNLAVAAALEGLNVAVVDLDRQRSFSKWWARRPEAAVPIGQYQGHMSDVDDVLGIDGYDLLIVDTPTAIEEYPEQIKALILAADLVLIPSQPSPTDTESVTEWMKLVSSFGRPATFVLNRVNRRATHGLLSAKRDLNAAGDLCPMEIGHFEDFGRATALGFTPLEIKGMSGTDDIKSVWQFVRKHLGL